MKLLVLYFFVLQFAGIFSNYYLVITLKNINQRKKGKRNEETSTHC